MAERRSLRIGSRRSALAMWQAQWVKARLEELHTALSVEIIGITSQGDVDRESPLPEIGGKGLFTQELDRALLSGDIDLAVHSLKDLPTKPTEGLQIGAVPEREDARDVFVGKGGLRLEELPPQARVGTSSLRRRAMVRHLRPDVEVTDLRGNVGTRVRRVQEDENLHGAVLAFAGLHRLELLDDAMQVMDLTTWVPAVSQGALGVVTRAGDESVLELVRAMDHAPTRAAVTAERALLARLEGGCHVPVGGHARLEGETLVLRSLVADPSGQRVVRDTAEGPPGEAEALGRAAAERLLAGGAAEILVSLENWRTTGGDSR